MEQQSISETTLPEKKIVEFAVDPKLMKKINLMIKKVTDDDDQDNYLILDGDGGSGKSNASVGIAYLVSQATGRPFSVDNVFFDMDKAIEFAKNTKEQIIIFDEPAFGGLKAEWRKKTQINLIKLLFTSRKKRHFVIINLVKFTKFNDDIIEKAMALIRIYKRSETKKERRFLYIPHKNITPLLDFWKKKHKRAYIQFSIFRGTLFRYVLPEIIDKDKYEEIKDAAILTIGAEESKDKIDKEAKLQLKILNGYKRVKDKGYNGTLRDYMTEVMELSSSTPTEWSKKLIKMGIMPKKAEKKLEIEPLIIDKGLIEDQTG